MLYNGLEQVCDVSPGTEWLPLVHKREIQLGSLDRTSSLVRLVISEEDLSLFNLGLPLRLNLI